MVVEEYYSAKRRALSKALETSFINAQGKDLSDIIRGKIISLDEILDTRNVFKRFDEFQEKVKKGAN